MSKTIELSYTPQPKQAKLHSTVRDEHGEVVKQILYGGAAGGGKSHSMRWDAYSACLGNPGLDAYLFRRTRVELENTHIKRLRQDLPEELGRYNETKNRWEFPNGAFLNFCYAEHEKDVEKYNSVEFHWLGIDEAGQFTPYQLSYLKTRMRLGGYTPVEDIFPRLIMGANPGGVSHNYLKQMFIVGREPEVIFYDETMRDPQDPTDRGWPSMFIPAKIADNRYLDKNYAAVFGGLSEVKQKQLRDGDWDVIPGAYFDCWNPDVNVVRPFEIPEYWGTFMACDWGHATPFWIGEFAIDDGEIGEEDDLYLVWEWYGSEKEYGLGNKGLRMDAEDVAREVRRLRKTPGYGVADPSMWRTDSGPSAQEKASRGGLYFAKADNERVAGWQEMYDRIKAGKLKIFSTCKAAIACIPTLEVDPNKPEDILKQGEDHPGDGIRYGCMSRPLQRAKPPEEPDILAPVTFDQIMQGHLQTKDERKRI